jgi:hypothetical protein
MTYRTKDEMTSYHDWVDQGYDLLSTDILNHPMKVLANNLDYCASQLEGLISALSENGVDINTPIVYNKPNFIVQDGMSFKEAILALDKKCRSLYNEIMGLLEIDPNVFETDWEVTVDNTGFPAYNSRCCVPNDVYNRWYFTWDSINSKIVAVNSTNSSITYSTDINFKISTFSSHSVYVSHDSIIFAVNNTANNHKYYSFNPETGEFTLIESNPYPVLDLNIVSYSSSVRIMSIYYNTDIKSLRYKILNLAAGDLSIDNAIFTFDTGQNHLSYTTKKQVNYYNNIGTYVFNKIDSTTSSCYVYFSAYFETVGKYYCYVVKLEDIGTPGTPSAELFKDSNEEYGNDVKTLGAAFLSILNKQLVLVSFQNLSGVNLNKYEIAVYLSEDMGTTYSIVDNILGYYDVNCGFCSTGNLMSVSGLNTREIKKLSIIK